ncbi:hypothetical protein J6590_026810 [Homalodisca vitripennis]|nr:hypothetical protein J6590_026810 [Homalodisca vitripennis]
MLTLTRAQAQADSENSSNNTCKKGREAGTVPHFATLRALCAVCLLPGLGRSVSQGTHTHRSHTDSCCCFLRPPEFIRLVYRASEVR